MPTTAEINAETARINAETAAVRQSTGGTYLWMALIVGGAIAYDAFRKKRR